MVSQLLQATMIAAPLKQRLRPQRLSHAQLAAKLLLLVLSH